MNHDGTRILVSSWKKDAVFLLDNQGRLLRTFHVSDYRDQTRSGLPAQLGLNLAMNCDGRRMLMTLKQGSMEVVLLVTDRGELLEAFSVPPEVRGGKSAHSSSDHGFGSSLDVNCDGTKILIGAEKGNLGWSFLYSNKGELLTKVQYPHQETEEHTVGHWVGSDVAINYKGNMILAVGGVYNTTTNHVSSGAYIFKDDGTPLATLHSPLNETGRDFGELWRLVKCQDEVVFDHDGSSLYHPESNEWHSDYRKSSSTLDYKIDCSGDRVLVAGSYNSLHLYESSSQDARKLEMPFESSATGYDVAISGNGMYGVVHGDYLLKGTEQAQESTFIYYFGPKQEKIDELPNLWGSFKIVQIVLLVLALLLLIKRRQASFWFWLRRQSNDCLHKKSRAPALDGPDNEVELIYRPW
jgi:hypothetical protein